MNRAFRKFKAIYGVCAQDWLAYKANGVIWILTDMVTALTMPLVWANAAKAGMISGYDSSAFVLYYLAMLLFGSFITSHMMWEIGFEIKEGQFQTYLVRPFSFFTHILIRNFAWRSIRFVFTLPFFVLLLIGYSGWLNVSTVYIGWEFWVSVILGHFVSITFVLAIAMISLWVQEAHSLFELYYVPQLFLSGYLFPIAILPGWAQQISKFLPFYYTTGLPVELFVRQVKPGDALPLLLGQVAWIVVMIALHKALFKRGLRVYAGVGL